MDTTETNLPLANSRYQEVTRRAFLRRAAQAAGALAALPLISSCGSDAEAFAAATTTSSAPSGSETGATVTTTTTTTTTAPTTTAATTTEPVTAAEMMIAFTYAAASGGGRVSNPYVAVWIEDEAGELVNTVALWFLQSQKGLKWLSDLRRWYQTDGSSATIDTVSSATRSPGSYTVAWDFTDLDGQAVLPAQYHVCIEAAREHGPYSLIRELVSVDTDMAAVQLAEDGELTGASVALA